MSAYELSEVVELIEKLQERSKVWRLRAKPIETQSCSHFITFVFHIVSHDPGVIFGFADCLAHWSLIELLNVMRKQTLMEGILQVLFFLQFSSHLLIIYYVRVIRLLRFLDFVFASPASATFPRFLVLRIFKISVHWFVLFIWSHLRYLILILLFNQSWARCLLCLDWILKFCGSVFGLEERGVGRILNSWLVMNLLKQFEKVYVGSGAHCSSHIFRFLVHNNFAFFSVF